ncbi:hypothetical protein QCM80_45470, partial [Bradyrhizobium sp. SSUT112]|uniref:hypothetical protein n=1 Tax=Bradyrhizobium sp. SSUT112 TaxID=3040604 RepID=UPI00244B78EF
LRSLTSLTASILNSRLNFRLRITTSGSMKHLNLVSIKPAAAQSVGISDHDTTCRFAKSDWLTAQSLPIAWDVRVAAPALIAAGLLADC